ncbi:hypothetical protein GCM10011386_32590 [Parapedobacter defluvii]|uniref:Uncharacterized protein n=1 Tax=Parapedobacter defluvii TaxID=2045106 RepID=A0ABQ1MB95_9SPHI|nr:hypothetical protein [Parapedobacter defluvii]GGC37973.1 hypothetical protein GCM10011386_32590 [Parapedobacter defluvii]
MPSSGSEANGGSDKQFAFEHNLKEIIAYYNTRKKGSLAQHEQLDISRQGPTISPHKQVRK